MRADQVITAGSAGVMREVRDQAAAGARASAAASAAASIAAGKQQPVQAGAGDINGGRAMSEAPTNTDAEHRGQEAEIRRSRAKTQNAPANAQ